MLFLLSEIHANLSFMQAISPADPKPLPPTKKQKISLSIASVTATVAESLLPLSAVIEDKVDEVGHDIN